MSPLLPENFQSLRPPPSSSGRSLGSVWSLFFTVGNKERLLAAGCQIGPILDCMGLFGGDSIMLNSCNVNWNILVWKNLSFWAIQFLFCFLMGPVAILNQPYLQLWEKGPFHFLSDEVFLIVGCFFLLKFD